MRASDKGGRALKAVSGELIVQGYRLKVFDAYRSACAVRHFVLWGIEDQDIRMKPYFYPELEKQELFVRGYISKQSSHSRGSVVDLTLLDMASGKEADMGSPYDRFSEVPHPGCRTITVGQYGNRMILQRAMIRGGFHPIDCERRHFSLREEPYPDTYFEFPVSSEYLKRQQAGEQRRLFAVKKQKRETAMYMKPGGHYGSEIRTAVHSMESWKRNH